MPSRIRPALSASVAWFRAGLLLTTLTTLGVAPAACSDDSPADDGAPPLAGVVAAGVRWFGRVDATTNPAQPRFAWPGTGFVAQLSGTSLAAQINTGTAAGLIFKAVVDGTAQPAFTASAGTASYTLAGDLAPGTHNIELYRQTEGGQGDSQLVGLTVGDGALAPPPAGPARLIEVIGDSISAGYGDLGALADTECFTTESHWDAYPSVLAREVGAEVSTIAASGRGVVLNYDGSMTGTMPMLYDLVLPNDGTPIWDFHIQPQAVVIDLGTNDISNDKGDPGTPFEDAYLALVQTVRAQYPSAFILCMIAPLLDDPDLTTIRLHIQTVVDARTAAGDTRIELFNGIGPQTSDKFACQYHPDVAEHQLMADLLAAELHAKLGW